MLSSMGRALAVRGEGVYVIEVEDGVTLTQAAYWTVHGGARPESWRYFVKLPTPGGMIERTVPADGVIHLRYATRPGQPWQGVSPLGMADETRALATWIEKRLS